MTQQVLVTDDSAVRFVRLNRPEKKNALTQAFSRLATARLLSAEAANAVVNDVVDAGQVDEAAEQTTPEIAVLPAGTVALSRGGGDDIVERIDVETMLFKERLRSDEISAAIAVFLSRKI